MNNKYPSKEKLKAKKHIDYLFDKGKWLVCGNIRIIEVKPNEESTKVGVSVSKRYFKRAVDRNRVKRLLREAYRLNKALYREAFGTNSYAMLFWTSSKLPSGFLEVEQNFIRLCEAKRGK